MTEPDFEALRPHAQRIADTQRALRDPIRKNLDRELDTHQNQPIRWDDLESKAAHAWAMACTRYTTPQFLINAGYRLTMTWPEHVHRIIDTTDPVRPEYRDQILQGLRLRAALDPHTGQPALGKPIRHAGCTGSFQPKDQRCDECNAHYVLRRQRERCRGTIELDQTETCDRPLQPDQWALGLCKRCKTRASRTTPTAACNNGKNHMAVGDEGDTTGPCAWCKRPLEWDGQHWVLASNATTGL